MRDSEAGLRHSYGNRGFTRVGMAGLDRPAVERARQAMFRDGDVLGFQRVTSCHGKPVVRNGVRSGRQDDLLAFPPVTGAWHSAAMLGLPEKPAG